MLICTRCNTSKSGNKPTQARCECGGQFAVVYDGFYNDYHQDEEPQELELGEARKPKLSGRSSRPTAKFDRLPASD